MKAVDFVKKFGWDVAKYKADELKIIKSMGDKLSIDDNNLKRLVDSHELVMDYYGLTRAKEHAESNYTAPELKAALNQAIADVESCQ